MKRWFLSAFVCVVAWSIQALPVHAAQLTLQFTGLSLAYQGDEFGGLIYDSVSSAGGGGDPATATPLVTLSYFVDGNLVGIQTTDIWADVTISTEAIADTGDMVTNPLGGIFDILVKNQTPGWGLALDVFSNSWEIVFNNNQLTILGSATAGNIFADDLPFGLAFDPAEPVIVSFSSQMTNVMSSNGYLTNFSAFGTGEINGTLVPEPGSIAMVGMGLVSVAGYGLRRRLQKARDLA